MQVCIKVNGMWWQGILKNTITCFLAIKHDRSYSVQCNVNSTNDHSSWHSQQTTHQMKTFWLGFWHFLIFRFLWITQRFMQWELFPELRLQVPGAIAILHPARCIALRTSWLRLLHHTAHMQQYQCHFNTLLSYNVNFFTILMITVQQKVIILFNIYMQEIGFIIICQTFMSYNW